MNSHCLALYGVWWDILKDGLYVVVVVVVVVMLSLE